MRFAAFRTNKGEGLAAADKDGRFHGLLASDPSFPGTLAGLILGGDAVLKAGAATLLKGAPVDLDTVTLLPPLSRPGKILCVGLNYVDHSLESGFTPPDYPTVFVRFPSSLIGHGAPLIRPQASIQLDYEGEMVAVIGKGGRHISKEAALDHIVGYSIFNDGSVRDYQKRTPQWTVGKNFDGTGAFGPVFVTADELPAGCRGLHIETRLNGKVMQSASTDDMIFDVASLVSILSAAMTLEAGDIIVSGTPSGVGVARVPPLFMKAGDICEIELEGVGVLRNRVEDEQSALAGLVNATEGAR